MAKRITEVLKEMNEDITLLKTVYKKPDGIGPLSIIFYHAYMPEGRFLLPEGTPPFKQDPAPIGMSPINFIQEISRFKLFLRADLPANKRETMFIQLCESIHPDEAKILIAIKDQKLGKMFPNLTWDVLADAGYLPPKEPSTKPPKLTKTNTGDKPKTPKKSYYKPKKKKEVVVDESGSESD